MKWDADICCRPGATPPAANLTQNTYNLLIYYFPFCLFLFQFFVLGGGGHGFLQRRNSSRGFVDVDVRAKSNSYDMIGIK